MIEKEKIKEIDKRNEIIQQIIEEGYGVTDLSKIMPIIDNIRNKIVKENLHDDYMCDFDKDKDCPSMGSPERKKEGDDK